VSRSTRRIEGDECTGGTGVRPLFGRETRRAEHAGELSEIADENDILPYWTSTHNDPLTIM
jgi:hypothetical protein